MNIVLITTVEIIYLIYMFNFFKTTYSINHPLEFIVTNNMSDFFNHPIMSGVYENKICSFGKLGSIIISLYLILRLFLNFYNKKFYYKLMKYNKYLFLIIFIICFMNLNAVIYFLPIFTYEFVF